MPSIGEHQHIVRSYDNELQRLLDGVARMAGLAESQLAGAIQAMAERDGELAMRVAGGDDEVDNLDHAINDMTVRLLALRAPVADDLRLALTTLKISSELERVADHAKNAAKRTLVLNQLPPVPSVRAVARMGWLVLELLKEVMDAYLARDADRAEAVWRRDQEVDDLHSSLFRELLTYMMEDARNITPCTHLLFIAKNIERIGDHATNIAELTHFLVRGSSLTGERPKRDTTSEAIPEAPPRD